MILYLGNQLSVHGTTPTSVETLGERLKEDHNIVQASSVKNQFFRLLHMWFMVIKYRKADFVLIDTYSTSAFLFAWTSALLARKLALRYIPVLHGGGLPERARKSPAKLTSYLKGAYKVVCPSPWLKEEMNKVIELEYKVVPNAIDRDDYPFTERKGFTKSGPRMLWVRSFDKIYNPTLAVRVLEALKEQGYPQAELCMVGPDKDGSLADVQKLAKDLHINDKIRITGRLSKREWIELSTGYDVFINTTNVDNTPVSVIESLALGLPVISTNVGGIPHILESGKSGILVEAGSVDSFVNAIRSLEDAGLYSKLAGNGRTLAEGYSWDRVRPAWMSILK